MQQCQNGWLNHTRQSWCWEEMGVEDEKEEEVVGAAIFLLNTRTGSDQT